MLERHVPVPVHGDDTNAAAYSVHFFERSGAGWKEQFTLPAGPFVAPQATPEVQIALSADGKTLAVGRDKGPWEGLGGLTLFDVSGGTPVKISSGVIRNPPPTPNMPDKKPTAAPMPRNTKMFTDISAMGK